MSVAHNSEAFRAVTMAELSRRLEAAKAAKEKRMATKKEETKAATEAKPKKLPALGEWYVFTADEFTKRFGDKASHPIQMSALGELRQSPAGPYVIVKVTHRPVVEAPKQTSFIVRPNPTAQKKGGE